MIIDIGNLPAHKAYITLTQTVLPRPIAWAMTVNEDSSYNLAPFSFFNAVCSDPPLVVFSVGRQADGRGKDTLTNIETRSGFVVNIASVSQLPELNQSSATLPYGESEISANNIVLTEVEEFSLPRIADCKVAMMCRTYEIQTIGNNNQALIFGEVTSLFVDDSCIDKDAKGRTKILADKIEPLARLGAGEYATFGNILSAQRPD